MLKRTISIILVAIVLFTIPTKPYVFASNNECMKACNTSKLECDLPNNLSKSEQKQIDEDINTFINWGFTLDSITQIKKYSNENIAYSIDSPVKSTIEVDKIEGGTKYLISEGTKLDEVVLYDNGDLYLDGNEVKVSYSDIVDSRAAGIVYTNTTTCPSGSASDYTKQKGTTQKANVALSKTLGSITITALAVVIGVISFQAGISITAAQAINQIVDSSNASSTGLSYKATLYYHKNSDSGWIGGKLVTKYVTTWYTKKNYKGKTTKKTTYRYGVTG